MSGPQGGTRGVGLEPAVIRDVTGMPIYVVPLGYTRPPLSLNDRGKGWRAHAAKVRELRTRVAWRLRALEATPVPRIHVELHYVPADARKRDADNLVATLKPCIDAMTAAGTSRSASWPLVADDDPGHVTWSAPIIHAPDDDGARLWLVVKALGGAR